MNKTIATLALFSAAGAVFAQDASSSSSQSSSSISDNLSIIGTFAYESQYVFRGAQLDRHAVQPGVEVGYAIGQGQAYAGVWGSLPISNRDGIREFDYYFGYLHDFKGYVRVDAGFTYYTYAGNYGYAGDLSRPGPQQTREIYVGVTGDVLLSPKVYFYYNFDLQQTVFEGSISYNFQLGEYINVKGLALQNIAYLGFLQSDKVNAQSPKTSNGYSYLGVASNFVYAVNDYVSTSFGIRWAYNNDGHGGNSVNGSGRKDNQFWVGGSVTFKH